MPQIHRNKMRHALPCRAPLLRYGPFGGPKEGIAAILCDTPKLSEAFYADAVRRVNLLTLAFALYFPAFERLRSTRSLA